MHSKYASMHVCYLYLCASPITGKKVELSHRTTLHCTRVLAYMVTQIFPIHIFTPLQMHTHMHIRITKYLAAAFASPPSNQDMLIFLMR